MMPSFGSRGMHWQLAGFSEGLVFCLIHLEQTIRHHDSISDVPPPCTWVPAKHWMEHCVFSAPRAPQTPQWETALPPQFPWTKQVMLMLLLSCWQGQQGYSLSPPIPDEPADEWHITANAPTVVLSGKWDEDETLCAGRAMSPSLWTSVFRAMWVESCNLFIVVNHFLCPYLSFILWKSSEVCYVHPGASYQGRGCCFVVIFIRLCKRWNHGTPTHTLSSRKVLGSLAERCNSICFCEAKFQIPVDDVLTNLICRSIVCHELEMLLEPPSHCTG